MSPSLFQRKKEKKTQKLPNILRKRTARKDLGLAIEKSLQNDADKKLNVIDETVKKRNEKSPSRKRK